MAAKKPRKKAKIRVAHELSKRRRNAIEQAMNAHELEDRPEWDRGAEWSSIRFYRKIIKPGTRIDTQNKIYQFNGIEDIEFIKISTKDSRPFIYQSPPEQYLNYQE